MITTFKAENVEAFLREIRASNSRWEGNPFQQKWVFRGQSSDWPLLPSAWRKKGTDYPFQRERAVSRYSEMKDGDRLDAALDKKATGLGVDRSIVRKRYDDFCIDTLVDIAALDDFRNIADQIGLFIETLSSSLVPDNKHELGFRASEDRLQASATVGLAQHHGMPTRLLDWSSHPLKAAFFACDDIVNERVFDSKPKIVVWALRIDSLIPPRGDYGANGPPYLHIVKYPRHKNNFMHAQDGVFTVTQHTMDFYLEKGRWPAVEEIDVTDPIRSNFELMKFTLRSEHADELFKKLIAEEITKAHMMPSYQSVADTVRTIWRLQKG